MKELFYQKKRSAKSFLLCFVNEERRPLDNQDANKTNCLIGPTDLKINVPTTFKNKFFLCTKILIHKIKKRTYFNCFFII